MPPRPWPLRLARAAARWAAMAYPRRACPDRDDTRLFLEEAATDAWASHGWAGLFRVAGVALADLGRAWTGRSALALSVTRSLPLAARWSLRRSTLMDRLIADLRYSCRVLARAPGFTAVAVLTLALGIGSATAVYAVADGVLLRPFPYPDMHRIGLLSEVGAGGQQMSVSWPDFQDWVAQNEAFEELGIFRGAVVTLTGPDQAERLNGANVSAAVFASMGIQPQAGRTFGAAEDAPGAARVAIISDRLWRSHFAARADMIGQSVVFNNQAFSIIGVMPPGMRFPSRLTDVWLPLGLIVSGFPPRGAHPGLTGVGRLKTGVSFEQARAAMAAIATRLADAYPTSNKGVGVVVTPYYDQVVQSIRPALYMLLGAVALLVLIACTNLASLMLARAEGRQRELAVRAALGAGRGKLLRQLLVESALLAGAGGLAGVGLAFVAVRAFVASQPTTIPRIDLLGMDWRVAAFAAAVSALTVVLFGLLPALRASVPNLQQMLRDVRGGGGRSARLRRVLVASQVAVAAVMLVGAGLLAKSLGRLTAIELGFEPSKVVTMRLTIADAAYPSPEAWIEFHRSLLDRLAGAAGVEALGLNSAVPLGGSGSESPVMKEGDPMPSADRPGTMCLFQSTGGEYFKAMGIQILRGRVFDGRDLAGGAPVVVVDATLAARLFGDENPIGRRIAFEFNGHDLASMRPIWREVVGVVQHVRHYGLIGGPPYVQVYAPFTQLPIWVRDRRPTMALFARTTGDADAMVATVRRAVGTVDPRIPVYGVQTMDDYVSQTVEQPRLSAMLVSGFAGVALVLAAVGLYGVLSYLVSQRTREIGVRLALGARPGHIIIQVVRQGLAVAVVGLVAGLGAALAVSSLIRAQLYEISPTDPATFAVVAVVLALTALAATSVPARRASRVDAIVALKTD